MSPEENSGAAATPPRKPGKWEMARRRFLYTIGVGIVGAGLTYGYATQVEPFWLRVRRRPMPMPDLPEALDGKTLLHVSDVHIGPRVDNSYLARVMRTAQRLKPDMVAITGDMIDGDFAEDMDAPPVHLRAVLEALPAAPLGTFAVLGNHDYGHNWSNHPNAERLVREYERVGVQVLRNATTHMMHGLQVVGIDDAWAQRADLAMAFHGFDAAKPALVLVHNPDVCDWSGWPAGLRAWTLSGHTHGGQCKAPFLEPPMLPVANRRYTSGVFDITPTMNLSISTGVGYLTQARFFVPPEIVLFTLRRA